MKNPILIGFLSVSAGVLPWLGVAPANAITIIKMLPEYSYDGGPPFPSPSQLVGTFSYLMPSGFAITSASLTGFFGNNESDSTAPVEVRLDGVQVATCIIDTLCYEGGGPHQWYYPFQPHQFSLLEDGLADLTAVQTEEYFTRLGMTMLTIVADPVSVPVPAPILGASVAYGLSRRLRQRIRLG